MSTETHTASASQGEAFPVAAVRETSGGPLAMVRQSRLWLLTLACFGLAVWLAWQSVPLRGPTVVITFPEGHGLKVGDAVRYRGIEVGQVEGVRLSADLQSVEAVVVLNPEAEAVNREGSRFWIVRPVVSLTEVRGLDTLVGARYIGVSPGDPDNPAVSAFDGLPSPPADELAAGGLTLVLRAPERHGIGPGAPLDWRGIPVGVVLSAGLAPDARHVDFTVRVDRPYRRLIRAETRFWITSGFDMDIGLTGVRLNAESLATIARGGISLMTPASATAEACRPGHVFPLSQPPEEEWLEAAGSVPFVDFPLPETVMVEVEATASFLGFTRTTMRSQSGVMVSSGNETLLVTPDFAGDRMRVSHPAFGDRVLRLANRAGATGTAEVDDPTVADVAVRNLGDGLLGVPVISGMSPVTQASFRTPTHPEACLVVRTAVADGRVIPVIQSLDVHQLKAVAGGYWQLVDSSLDVTPWHGAAVVAIADGSLLGILVADEQQTAMIPAAATWWKTPSASVER